MSIDKIEEQIRAEGVEEIALQFVDILGILHTLWVPAGDFASIVEDGVHTDGSSLAKAVSVARSDVKLMPDPASFVVLPEELFPVRVARCVCDLYHPESDRPFELDPRYVLKKAVADARGALGDRINYYTASEIEYFLLQKDEGGALELIDKGGYLATPPADRGANLRLVMARMMRQMGLVVEKHHHEVPHGKSEYNLKYSQAVATADRVYLVKFLIKLMAAREGLTASFMPKPFHGEYGAGLHTHVSLINDRLDANVFHDPAAEHGLTTWGLRFLAGILAHAPGLAGITNPSVNSYKRLVPGWEAPVNISWARYNRSVLVRVPPGSGKGTRFEYRPTDGSCNFYLAYAALLAAGLDGIARELDPPDEVPEDIYEMSPAERRERGIETLPGNLAEALDELAADKCLRGCLGEAMFDKYMELKRGEWHEFSTLVHDWERTKYLDV